MFSDPTFFVALAFGIVVATLIYLKVPSRLLAGLDSRAAQIASDLARARDLREEAEALLREYQKRGVAAEAQAEEILSTARANAMRMAEESQAQLEAQIARRQAQAETRIANAEAQLLKDIRAQAGARAIAAAREIIRNNFDDSGNDRIIDDNVKALDN